MMAECSDSQQLSVCYQIALSGNVQGIGFRPYIYQLAKRYGLVGTVRNTSEGLLVDVEGIENTVKSFIENLRRVTLPNVEIRSLIIKPTTLNYFDSFTVLPTLAAASPTAIIPRDLATCTECLAELFDPSNRRYFYPFTSCAECGPRYSILTALPWERKNTAMNEFGMCLHCLAEYNEPTNRRFQAEANTCPACGPQLVLWNKQGEQLASGEEGLRWAVDAIEQGKILALKGLGGFQLLVDVQNEQAITRLRLLKERCSKPFAVMFKCLEQLMSVCVVTDLERNLLLSAQAPIVLLKRIHVSSANRFSISDLVAPGSPLLGAFLPYTPVHHLIMSKFENPLIVTSGNLSGESIYIDEHEARSKLGQLADLFLVHNRRIIAPLDDSVVRVVAGKSMLLRCARGYAPVNFYCSEAKTTSKEIAFGGHQKNTIAISVPISNNKTASAEDKEKMIVVSQHIGSLSSLKTLQSFTYLRNQYLDFYSLQPQIVISDMHPAYLSTQAALDFSREKDISHITVQHHYAHALSCMFEHDISSPALAVVWDGSGWGIDGSVWGGEFLSIENKGYKRVGHFRTFPLPGAEAAIKDIRRIALGMLFEIYGTGIELHVPWFSGKFNIQDLNALLKMLGRRINSPYTSSVGRLFDGVAYLLDLAEYSTFEGEAAMKVEFLALTDSGEEYEIDFEYSSFSKVYIVNWEPMLLGILDDLRSNLSTARVASKFQNTLVKVILEMANRAGISQVVMSGGCFQNAYLLERAIKSLQQAGFFPYWPQKLPANDGGISLGQLLAKSRDYSEEVLER